MGLWVRSQSKETLLKVSKVCVCDEEIYATTESEFDERIGIYKSKERALQILDEIQNILNPKLFVNVKPSEEMAELLGGLQYGKTLKMKNDFEYKELSTYVYEMPSE